MNLLLVLLAATAAAQKLTQVPVERETLEVIGWSKACSVAVDLRGYPRLGDASIIEPVKTRVGTITIPPGSEKDELRWEAALDGVYSWNPETVTEARARLKDRGYGRKGYTETVRPEPVFDDPGLREILLTTAVFRTRAPELVAAPWRLSQIHYTPVVATCALLVYEKEKSFALRLVRLENPSVRRERARAHVDNGLRLINTGDRLGALAETEIAAAMAPDYALARFHFAEQLCVNGRNLEALDHLAAAVKLDKAYKKKARESRELADIAWMPRFKSLTR